MKNIENLIITKSNYDSWAAEIGGMRLLEVGDLSVSELGKFLQRLDGTLEDTMSDQLTLSFRQVLTAEQLSVILAYIKNHPGDLPFVSLSMSGVTAEVANMDEFKQLALVLNEKKIKKFELHIEHTEEKKIVNSLTALANEIHYPLVVSAYADLGEYIAKGPVIRSMTDSPEYRELVKRLVKNIQSHNMARLLETDHIVKIEPAVAVADEPLQRNIDPSAERIKLKELMSAQNARSRDYDEYIKLEVQHVEVEQQQQVQQVEEILETIIEEVEQQAFAQYDGELVDAEKFRRDGPYEKYAQPTREIFTDDRSTIWYEYFSALPGVIRYFTPDAATVIAKHMRELTSLNADNLPQHFLLKLTPSGYVVLDYDPYLAEKKVNVFTPKINPINDYENTPYNLSPKYKYSEISQGLISNSYIDSGLERLWLNYGDTGARYFFSRLKQCNDSQPGIVEFLHQHYLRYIHDWSHLLENKGFLEAIDQIKSYSPEKITCLKKFLYINPMGANLIAYDLKATLLGFDKFWDEWVHMSQQHGIDLGGINRDWSVPSGGNPLVYMERMLAILKNARNLNEQVLCLDGIYLNARGPYEATRNEGFRVVATRMEFGLNPKDRQHRVELETLFVEAIKTKKKKTWTELYFAYACRYLGQQKKGIAINEFIDAYDKFQSQFNEHSRNLYRQEILFVALLFLGHERSIDSSSSQVELSALFQNLYDMKGYGVLNKVAELLYELHKMDIRLSASEGIILCQRIAAMNTSEFESFEIDKSIYLDKIFSVLKENKTAALKMLASLSRDKYSRFPFVFALDTADYLSKDKKITQMYADDLLLFSSLINTELDEVYYESRNDEKTKSIIPNLEKVKAYLHHAATLPLPNNFDYAFRSLICSSQQFTYKSFLAAFAEIKELKDFDFKAVDDILRKHKFNIESKQPDIFNGKLSLTDDIKDIMIEMLVVLEAVEKNGLKEMASYFFAKGVSEEESNLLALLEQEAKEKNTPQAIAKYEAEEKRLNEKSAAAAKWQQEKNILVPLPIAELQARLKTAWKTAGAALSIIGAAKLRPLLANLKSKVITNAIVEKFGDSVMVRYLANIKDLKSFSDHSDFEKIDRIYHEADHLLSLIAEIMKRDNAKAHEAGMIELFKNLHYSWFDYETLSALLKQFERMPHRDYYQILRKLLACENILKNKDRCLKIIETIAMLDLHHFPSSYIERIVKLTDQAPDETHLLITLLISAYDQNNDDRLVCWLLTDDSLTMKQRLDIARVTASSGSDRDLICAFMKTCHANKPELDNVLILLQNVDSKAAADILQLIAKCEASTSTLVKQKAGKVHYAKLVDLLCDLGENDISKLLVYSKSSNVNLPALYNAMLTKAVKPDLSMEELLLNLERSPYGKRDDASQFDVREVERVINQAQDINNNNIYTHSYRQKMMEAFLFVNRAGQDLPIYNNKPAKLLSNEEIKNEFQAIKMGAKKFSHLDPFQRRLHALALMREAMYRATGQFAYSTQIIALIDCMMHGGDVISNIDTGQGKSLIDTMKAALLWLESDRVDLSTSSIVDATRDLGIYSPFLTALNIPHSNAAVTSSLPFADYKQNGINYGTMAQFALFYSKAKGEGVAIGKENDRVSLVMNESDYTVLDDKTVYRYAASGGVGTGTGNEWIYREVNAFIQLPVFTAGNTSQSQDIAALRRHIARKARENNASARLANKFSDKQLLAWLESAIIVRHRLRENFDYIVTQVPEEKIVNGVPQLTRAAKILMKDGKVSADTLYGNGMQQLLHAHLNEKHKTDQFVIEPEARTLISLNNRNMIDFYRSKKGFIWGSSGTVGFGDEIKLQYEKYGFAFSKIDPHQKKIVKVKPRKVLANEDQQFADLLKTLSKNHKKQSAPPALVFFKDIETANRFFNVLKLSSHHQNIQLYTGVGNEAEVIKQAAQPGMITVTTSALERNTDVLYDKSVGMNVYDAVGGIERRMMQRGGRTGRQGSPGEIHTVLNQEDFPNMSVEQYMAKLERTAEVEREFNENLYSILGFLLAKADGMPKDFYRHSWAAFGDQLEAEYRQSKLNRTFHLERFVKKAVKEFNEMTNQAVTSEEVLSHLREVHVEEVNPPVNHKNVTITECVPAEMIAYQFAMTTGDTVPVDSMEIKKRLTAIFDAIKNNKPLQSNNDYLAYLNSGKNIKDIQVIHQEFLSEFLTQQATISNKRPAITRWFGFQGHLTKMTNHHGYLMMFNALSHIQGEKLSAEKMTDSVKLSVTTLLREYSENSWFVNKRNKATAKKIIADIAGAPDLDSVFNIIQASKLNIGNADIATNKQSFWRKHIKPLHSKGRSRLQMTLDNALNLTAALSNQKLDARYVDQLTGQLQSVTNTVMPALKSSDHLDVIKENFVYSDKHNAKVFISSLNLALKINSSREPVNSMQGRFAIFADKKKLKNKVEAVKSGNPKPT